MWDTGSYGKRNTGIGSMAFGVGSPIIQPCFAPELRGSARPTSGEGPYPPCGKGVTKKLRC